MNPNNRRDCHYCGRIFNAPVRGGHYHGLYFHCGCGAESGLSYLAPCSQVGWGLSQLDGAS